MITEVLLILPLCLILFFIWYRFQHLIKIMVCVGDILNGEDFLIHQRKALSSTKHENAYRGKANLLGHKWTYERVSKARDKVLNKTYAEYKQRELNKKGEKTGNALGKHVINLYATGISRWVKIRDVHRLSQDIENDLII